ncbi:hypothetical protein [Muricoccus aerilatus]|uniref:hypothetical protein n=1 Tax=Muricoccus aerilatus TaxID=452982 RepID=UPI0012EC1AD4|nr:hypothetical protein [Roseomonas aerilata]
MSGDKALDGLAAVLAGRNLPAADHHLEHAEKFFGHLKIALVTRLMEGEQDLIREAPGLARDEVRRGTWSFFIQKLFRHHVGDLPSRPHGAREAPPAPTWVVVTG